MPTIILFPGHKCTGDVNNWSSYFLDALKKLCLVIQVEYPWYSKSCKLDLHKFCDEIYEQATDSQIILIGHSMGSQFVYWMNLRFGNRVILSILIDGSLWGKFWWKDKDYSNVQLTADPIRNIFIQIMQYKKYQNFDVQALTSPVVSLWNLDNNPDRTKTRIESEIYFNNAHLNYKSVMFENVGHFMHLDKKVANYILSNIKTSFA